VNDRSWLPKQIQDKDESRYQERVEVSYPPVVFATFHELIIFPKAKKALAANFDALSETEQNAMLKGKGGKQTKSTADGDGKENVC